MYQIYTSEQLQKQLLELRKKKEEIRNSRISALKKYSSGLNGSAKESELHNIDRKIEDLERKLQALL
jgi:predicted RNase H-like nuclease (RuvC/YqgF family)